MTASALTELTHLRHQLRACLVAGRCDAASPLLAQLGHVAGAERSLRREYERWCLQFDLLAATRLA